MSIKKYLKVAILFFTYNDIIGKKTVDVTPLKVPTLTGFPII